VAEWVENPTAAACVASEAQVQSPFRHSGLRIWVGTAVAWIQSLAQGISICHGCGHLKTTTKPHTNVSFNSETIWKYVNCRISLSKDFAAYVKKITYKGLLLENPRSFQCKPLVKMEAILLLLLKKD